MPVEDMAELGGGADARAPRTTGPRAGGPSRRQSIWPAIHPAAPRADPGASLDDRVRERAPDGGAPRRAGSTSWPSEDLVRAHHGSLAREQRIEVEDALKEGRLRAIVATSSLELGIDMGAVDLVIQVESPGSVASGLQRIGRAGHQVGEPSRGQDLPEVPRGPAGGGRGDAADARGRDRGDPLPAQPARRARPAARRDVRGRGVAGGRALRRRPARGRDFADLSDDVFAAVLDMLSGRYPSDDFAELRPRLVWDRARRHRPRTRGRRPARDHERRDDPGSRAVRRVPPDGTRVGELDEEMVYESRRGEVFVLGASSWRIEDITRDRRGRQPGAGRAGQDAVLEGRQARAPDRARPCARRVHAELAGRTRATRARAAASRRRARRARRREPRVVP